MINFVSILNALKQYRDLANTLSLGNGLRYNPQEIIRVSNKLSVLIAELEEYIKEVEK